VREIEDFTDERLKVWCIHCGAGIADIDSNRDHVPTKSLLTKDLRERGADYDRGKGDEYDYLPRPSSAASAIPVSQPTRTISSACFTRLWRAASIPTR
jgi:hypothetical protein